jgi:hypothetical protein
MVLVEIGTRKEDTTASFIEILNNAMTQGGSILKEIVQVGMTNGLVGAALMMVILDMLHQKQVISDTTFNLTMAMLIAGVGVDLTGSLISDFAAFVPFSKPAAANVAVPSVTTLVIGGGSSELNALLGKLANK